VGKLGILKKLAWMPLVVAPLLGGCFLFDDAKEDSQTEIAGFASDTTAIIFSYNWETTGGSVCGPGNAGSCASSKNYLDWELRLVDVRFKKVYWQSKVKNNYGRNFSVRQWDDSTIIIQYNSSNYMLWAIGSPKPHGINLNWNTEKENLFGYRYNWLRWENDSLLAEQGSIVIDTKTKTVNKREVADGINWWGKVAGGGGGLDDR
jgi:hypothetical protein